MFSFTNLFKKNFFLNSKVYCKFDPIKTLIIKNFFIKIEFFNNFSLIFFKNFFFKKIFFKKIFFKKTFFKKVFIKIYELFYKLNIFKKNFFNSFFFFKIKLKSNFFKKNIFFFKKKVKNVDKFLKKFDFSERIILQKKLVFKKKYFSFVNNFVNNFFNFFFKKKVFLIFKKIGFFVKLVEKKKSVNFILKKVKIKIKKFKNFKFVRIFFKILFLSFKIKDSNFFLKWLTYQMDILFFKKHKKMVHLLYSFLKKYHTFFFKKTKTLGVFFSIRGKIGVSGNSKKRHIYLSYGRHSSSNKKLRINNSTSQVKTKTGVMGLNFSIFF